MQLFRKGKCHIRGLKVFICTFYEKLLTRSHWIDSYEVESNLNVMQVISSVIFWDIKLSSSKDYFSGSPFYI